MLALSQFDGVVNEYQTSNVVPHRLVLIPSLFAWYNVPAILLQLVPGVSDVGLLQRSLTGWANKFLDSRINKNKITAVRLKAGSMVFQGFCVQTYLLFSLNHR